MKQSRLRVSKQILEAFHVAPDPKSCSFSEDFIGKGNLSPAWVPAWWGLRHDTCQLCCLVLNTNLLLPRITEKRNSELHRSGWPIGMAIGDSLDCWLRCKDLIWMASLHELSPELCASKESEPGCKQQACEGVCLYSLLLTVRGCSIISSCLDFLTI